jgi:biopolymer transport protein TolR
MEMYRESKKPMSEINVVPYIDVMLVLLVIFMVTAPMMTQGINVELPKESTDAIDLKQTEPVVITVKQDGTYFMDVGKYDKEAASLQEVESVLDKIMRNNPQTPVLVSGDSKVHYAAVIELMASLQRAGVINLGLLTEPPN